MPSSAETALSWIKKIPRSLFLADKIPLIGEPPPIPLQQWTEALKTTFALKNLEIKTGPLNWTEAANLFQGIPNKKVFGFAIPGIAGVFFLSLSGNHLTNLASLILTGEEHPSTEIESAVEEGFINFLLKEALYTLEKSGQPEKMMPTLLETLPPLPMEGCLAMDIEAIINQKTIPCRLILTQKFQTALSSEFQQKHEDLYSASPLSEKIDITVSFEIAQAKMKLKELQSVMPGDFLVLNHCHIDPQLKAGPILLKVFNLPFFAGQLQDGKITLAEVSQYYEAQAHMQSDEHPEKKESEDFEFEGEELEEFEDDLEELSEEELEELDHAKESSEEKIEENEIKPEAHPLTEVAEIQAAPSVEETHETQESIESKEELIPEAPKTAKEMLAVGDIPLSLSVEIGRVNISLNKLIALTTGNILEVNSAGDSVDLVLNGKKVASGELLKIGDVFGVRIMDIGH